MGHRGLLEMMDMFVHYLDHGDGPSVFTYAKTYQLAWFKYVQFITCQL